MADLSKLVMQAPGFEWDVAMVTGGDEPRLVCSIDYEANGGTTWLLGLFHKPQRLTDLVIELHHRANTGFLLELLDALAMKKNVAWDLCPFMVRIEANGKQRHFDVEEGESINHAIARAIVALSEMT